MITGGSILLTLLFSEHLIPKLLSKLFLHLLLPLAQTIFLIAYLDVVSEKRSGNILQEPTSTAPPIALPPSIVPIKQKPNFKILY